THYVLAPIFGGLIAVHFLARPLRARYTRRSLLIDCAVVVACLAPTLPQIVSLAGRRGSLTWNAGLDWAGLVPLIPFGVLAVAPALSQPPRLDEFKRSIAFALAASIAGQIALVLAASLAGMNLFVPRFYSVVLIPATILAGIQWSRLGLWARV